MSGGLVVVADVRSKVLAPLMLGSVVFAIASSYMSAGLLVLAVFVQNGWRVVVRLCCLCYCNFMCVSWTTCLICDL